MPPCRRVLIAVFVFLCLPLHASSQAGKGRFFEEVDVSVGGAIVPAAAPAGTGAFSLGSGPNAVRFETGLTFLGNYGLGFGKTGAYNGDLISASRLTDFNMSYLHDFHHSNRDGFVIYGGGGLAYVRSRYVYTETGCPIICFPGELSAYSEVISTNNIGFGGQGGVKVPLRKGVGVRVGVEFWRILGSNALEPIIGGYTSNTPGYPSSSSVATNPDSLLRVTFGLYYRHNGR